MRPLFLFRGLVVLFLCWSSTQASHATHILGADLTYEYVASATPNQYRVTAHLFRDLSSIVTDPFVTLTCGKNECGNTLPGSFTFTLMRTGGVTAATGCASPGLSYEVATYQGVVQLLPAHWTLSIEGVNRRPGVVNIVQSVDMSLYVKAELDNSSGLVNSSPRFTTARLIQLASMEPQRYSLNAFDSEGDSLVYQLVQPLAGPTATLPCGLPTVGPIAPYFQLNAATGELLTVAGTLQQGFYFLAARVAEYRRLGGAWQQIGSITRDMAYLVIPGPNQVPVFNRVAPTGSATGQLLGQTIRVNPGQTLSLTLTAADPDAGQTLALSSEVATLLPGATFQDLGNGQGQLTWPVPAAQPLGRYVLTATAADNACPASGIGTVTLPILVTRQALATQQNRQMLAQPPFPVPFQDEVRFQFVGLGVQPVIITDELGRTVVQFATAADGSVVWRPDPGLAAGLYFARNLSGSQVARLAYSGQ